MKKIILLSLILLLLANIGHDQNQKLKIVALTFDDGPNPKFLSQLIPYFEKENIKATFFVIGSSAKENPKLIKNLSRNGHEIENHTYSHICLAKPSPKWTGCKTLSDEKILNEIDKTSKIIEQQTGKKPLFLRPPHFAMKNKITQLIEENTGIKVLKYDDRISIGSLDWVYTNPEKIVERTINRIIQVGDSPHIIVMHENSATVKALPQIINF